MQLPNLNGLEVLGIIGGGESGKVFGARDEAGKAWAVKVFEGMAINRSLLAKMTARLSTGGWPKGVVPLETMDFDGRPAFWVVPAYGEMEGSGDTLTWQVHTLQHRITSHPDDTSWQLVRDIATALGEMHARRVAHGNLKPGNIFFDENGQVKLADWALGNMPGISNFDYTDALLYQSPEQLVNPNGYLEESGYRWDVFAFGVLAYRILTGSFPRCDESFQSVCPATGETKKEGVHADAAKIAKNLLNQPPVTWQTEPQNTLEQGFRSWITRCLELSPEARPCTMLEVIAGFEKEEAQVRSEEARQRSELMQQKAERSGRRIMFFAGMATAACLLLAALWQLASRNLENERRGHASETNRLSTKAAAATARMSSAVKAQTEAEQTLQYQTELGLARLEASRQIGDRLFDWAMEKGHRSLPALDGRELRLKRLQRFFEDFLVRTADIKSLDDERARVRLQLAEVALSAGDAVVAELRLKEAIDGWTGNMDGEMRLRIGQNSLLLALLKSANPDEDAGPSFVAARQALAAVLPEQVDALRLEQLVAILDFHEAKLLAAKGEEGKALEQLMGATKKLNQLADTRPDAAVLRSDLAQCYLSSATILEGLGKIGDAREVRVLAVVELVKLLKANPTDANLRLELAGCYGAMAEASVLSGDVTAAQTASDEALKLLNALLTEEPDSNLAATRKGAQLGLQAGLLRDAGKGPEALKAFEAAILLLERQSNRDALLDYKLALLKWQKGMMLGYNGKKEEQILLLTKSRKTLLELESAGENGLVRMEEIQRSSAYLLGDLAHVLELSEKKAEAAGVYREAILAWESLQKTRPQSEEYQEGLEWIRQRAKGE